MGKVVILGASSNPDRYSYQAARLLSEKGYDFEPVGLRPGLSGGRKILIIRKYPPIHDVDTITLYMNPVNQREYYEYIIGMKPGRIIFNPGTENEDLAALAAKSSIKTLENCTLVMLRTGTF
ncbi:MAG TPA: CoA-binding protein [Cyclobacteriaceae bacterium]|nr:CoA-binding protein [Cyclobacteriaceae bacterium]